jgi:uncharacterized protein YbjQ (UPF0145 family)/DNA-directed RNA polymerase subunit RPC12/RpoP
MITFKCRSCSVDIEATDDTSGQIVDCPSCGQPIEVPHKKISAAERAFALSKIIITTTQSIEGRIIGRYIGVVTAEIIYGANIIRDILASGSDIIGGRVPEYESVIKDARQKALHTLREKALTLEADAVVGLSIDVEILGANNGMIMVTAIGTAIGLK